MLFRSISIGVVEKGAAIGSHIISGAVFDPRPLDELFPDWQARAAPVRTAVTTDALHWLRDAERHMPVEDRWVPHTLRNAGHYIVSLGDLCRWLAEQAESLGCNLLPGFAAADVLHDSGRVVGVVTGDMGVARNGTMKPNYQSGYELKSRYTVFAEGCRGHLGRQLMDRFALRNDCDPQVHGIGLKELWRLDPSKHQPGLVQHSFGWPLDQDTGGGSFLYHLEDGLAVVGFVVHLNYENQIGRAHV